MTKNKKRSSNDSRKTKYPGVYTARNESGGYEIVFDGPRIGGKRNQVSDVLDPKEFNTAAKAASERARRIAEVQNGKYIEPSKLTLREYLLESLATRKALAKIHKVNTTKNYNSETKFFCAPPLGDILLPDLSTLEIEKHMIKAIKDEKIIVSTARSYLSFLNRTLKKAVRNKIINENPAALVELPKAPKTEVAIMSPAEMLDYLQSISIEGIWKEYLTKLGYDDNQIESLWQSYKLRGIDAMPISFFNAIRKAENKAKQYEVYFNFATLSFGTGARRGEILGLRDADVDFEAELITFRQSVVPNEDGSALIQDSLKNDSSLRTISLTPTELKILKRQIKIRNEHKLKLGSNYQDHGLIFALPNGQPLVPGVLTNWYRRSFDRFGRPDFTLHDSRHTHASLLLMAGVPITDVSARLGHANPSITLSTYSHFLQERTKVASDKWGEILQNASI
ncbi:hypothetical protein CIG75_12995 [Tumebacillus algifaecis]|uniref:Tyr recombinase domain-containing protein n=1 Tax=Tumebacillus algifaecis TaxID=1214604 RepID=A0A223D356_9BACL|nr:site-specific integrase [Tumebacillus algifaecis]ASS75816.1 hypothetical protein CIG75_12995 [Tumebacillus algifaecis]